MRRVLMVCYYFPPLGGIGSLRALKFATYLPEFGWEPTVLSPRDGAYYRDPSLVFPERKVVRTGSLEISRVGKRALRLEGDDTHAAPVGGVLGRVRELVRRWIYRPDAQIGWYPLALRGGRRAAREQRFDVVFSTSFPITAHLIARKLSAEFGVPWVAEFRDLWTDLARYDSARRRRRDEATERSVLEAATEVVSVSQDWSELLLSRGARRVSVVTNGFDPEDFPAAADPARPTATYVGTYYPDRQDLVTGLRALGSLVRTGLLPRLTVRFVGSLRPGVRELLEAVGLSASFECTGQIPHREALRHMRESTLLLLAGPSMAASQAPALRGNIAGKVFEYLGSDRPILYVGDKDADIARLLTPFAGVAFVRPGDTRGAEEAIVSLLAAGSPVGRTGVNQYTRRSLTQRLAQCLERASV